MLIKTINNRNSLKQERVIASDYFSLTRFLVCALRTKKRLLQIVSLTVCYFNHNIKVFVMLD